MRYLLLLLFPFMTASALVKENYPLITLEAKYAQGKPGEKAEYYKIKATKGIRVDASHIDFKSIPVYKDLGKNDPIVIYVVDKGIVYTAPFYDTTIMTLDQEKLYNVTGISKFNGFVANNAYVIGVGEVHIEENGQPSIRTAWSTVIKVAK